MSDNERIPGTDVKPVPLPATEPESEAALAIKPGAWVEICIPISSNQTQYPHLQGAVLQVQNVFARRHEIAAANVEWPIANVRVVEHPSDLKQRLDAMERDRQRLVRAKGLNLEALEGRVTALEKARESHLSSIEYLTGFAERTLERLKKLGE